MLQVELHDRSNNTVKILSGAKNAAYHAVINQDGTGTFLIHRADPDFTTYTMLTGGIDGYIIHLLRKGPYEATFTDRFSFVVEAVTAALGQQEDAGAWFRISGRGTLCLLEDRICWPPGFDGANASSILAQWQTYAQQPGGSIMAGEIDRSASRFSVALTHSTDVRTSYTAAVLADSPKAYWRLDEASGNFADSSGNAHTATPAGSPTYSVNGATWDADKAITLSGAASNYLSVVDHADFVTPGSVEGWINCPVFGPDAVLLARQTAGNVGGWSLQMVDNVGHFAFFIYVGGLWHSVQTTTTLTLNQWHHIVGTWNGATLNIYVDGIAAAPPVSQGGTINNPGGPTVQIGRNFTGGLFTGSMDEIAYYTTALSAARVLAHYRAATGYASQTSIAQTVQLRFDNQRLLHDALVKAGPMDAQMVGLDYQSVDLRGTDKSATVKVAMGPQDSLLGATFERDASKVANWIVGQGTGEGINSKIAVQTDAAAVTALRRREAFLDDRQISDQAQLALDTAGSLALVKRADQRITTRFVDSPHTQLYRDFDLGDTIGLVVQPVGFNSKYRVIGITVTDQDSEVEDCALDLNSMRTEHLLKLMNGTVLPTVKSVSVLNRMPQGSAFNDSWGWSDSVAPGFPFHFVIFIPSNVLQLNYAKLTFFLLAFRTYNSFSATNTGAGSAHSHTVPIAANAAGQPVNIAAPNGSAFTSLSGPVTSAAINTEAAHVHSLALIGALGIVEGAVATGVTVNINGTDRTAVLGGGTGFTVDQIEIEIGQYLNIGVKNTIDLSSTGLGRILGHLRLTGYVQSA